jgi:hypothetical protein
MDDEQINAACEVFSGPWLRTRLKNTKTNDYVEVICALDRESYDSFIDVAFDGDDENELSDQYYYELFMLLTVSLGEDVWSTSEGQFIFSEFGEYLSNSFDVFDENVVLSFVSPDVGIHKDGPNEWNYST